MLKLSWPGLVLLLVCVPGQAQRRAQRAAPPVAPPATTAAPAGDPQQEREQFRQDFIKATETYRTSLQALTDSYAQSLQRLTEQHDKLKELYAEGLLARRELEASEAAVGAARTRLAEAQQQVASASTVLAAARMGPAAVEVAAGAAPARTVRAWTTGSRQIDGLINFYGRRYDVDPYLIYCVMHQESSFGAGATSGKGAQGLMQLMPATAARYGVTNAYDPAQSIMGGTRYLRDLLSLFSGRVDLVLAGYNAGEGAVMRYGYRVPPYNETRNYVRVISQRYNAGSTATVKPTSKPMPAPRPRATTAAAGN